MQKKTYLERNADNLVCLVRSVFVFLLFLVMTKRIPVDIKNKSFYSFLSSEIQKTFIIQITEAKTI